MSEAPGTPLGPETTLETGSEPTTGPDRREQLAAALEALPEAKEGEESQAPPEAAAAPVEGAPTTDPAPEPDPHSTPPPSWKKDYHEAFTKADPQLRAYIMQRETEMRQGIEQLIPKGKFADEISQAIQPFQANMQAAGVSPPQAIQTLMQADNVLRTATMDEKLAYLRQLLPQYGIDFGNIEGSLSPVDPRFAAMERELHNLRNTVTPVLQQQVEAQNQALLQDIEAFSRDKPHFEAVRPVMAQLLQSGSAANLAEAYEKALEPWAPILSEAEKGRQAAAEAEKRKAADDAAKAARAAAVQVKTSTPGRPPQTKAQDRRSMLAEQLDSMSDRF